MLEEDKILRKRAGQHIEKDDIVHGVSRRYHPVLSLCTELIISDPLVPDLFSGETALRLRLSISLPAKPVDDRVVETTVLLLAFQTSSLALRC